MIRIACRIIGWSILLAIVFATISPIGLRPRLGYGPDFDRFVGFLVSGLFLGFGYRRRWLWAVGFIAVAAFGISARTGADYSQTAQVVKAGKAVVVTSSNTSTVR